ncbi:MAG: hypothetical protein ACKO66_01115 [Flavobacteriales bacterium]
MKRTVISAFAIAFAWMMTSCSGGDTPKVVATKFLTASSENNYDEAKKYATEETGQVLDLVASMAKTMGGDTKKEKETFEVISEKIEGENATVTYKKAGDDAEQTLKLKKVSGDWKVSMSKEDMNKDESTTGGDENLDNGDAGMESEDTNAPQEEGTTTTH